MPAPSEDQRCPLCASASRVWTRRLGRELRRCDACGFGWIREGLMRSADGRSIYEDDTAIFTDPDQADYYRDDSTLDAARDKLRWVMHHKPQGGRLLDVGANVGYFAREAASAFDALGIEPGRRTVEWGREHLNAPLEIGTIHDDRPDFRGRFDVVTMFDVVEHLAEPREALARCRDYLAPGGRLFITTPDTGSVMARLLGSQWYYIDPVEHVSMFSRENLDRLLRETGLSVVETRTIGRRYRCSYIERRLRVLGRETPALRLAQLLALPLRLAPQFRVPLNLGDVMGLTVARAADVPG